MPIAKCHSFIYIYYALVFSCMQPLVESLDGRVGWSWKNVLESTIQMG
jgi:hypothetical protein